MANQIILVTGATGHQGGAVARHLLQRGGFTVYALVRDRDKPAAQVLAQEGAFLLQGDLGVFSVQSMEGGIDEEIQQGKSLADAALAAGTARFVYSSVGSAERKTGIPHFDSKFQIEEHIRSIALPHTIMRPVFFFHNYDRMRPMIEGGQLVQPLPPDLKVQQLSDDDYGDMVAQVFERPADFLNRAIEVASVDLTMTEVAATFSDVIGKPVAYQPISFDAFEQKAGHETTLMMRWFQSTGYNADFAQLQRDFGTPSDLGSYLRAHDWGTAARVPAKIGT